MGIRHRLEECDVDGWQRRFGGDGKHLVRLRPMALQHGFRIRHVALLPGTNPAGATFVAGAIRDQATTGQLWGIKQSSLVEKLGCRGP